MARHLLLWHHYAPAHLIEVAVKWPRSDRRRALSEGARPAHSTASTAEVLANYRRHRQRLADALRLQPTQMPPRYSTASSLARSAESHRGGWSRPLVPAAPPRRAAENKGGPSIERGGRPGQGDAVTARKEPSVTGLFAPDLLEAATALYDPTLPYHNASHALRAVTCGERLLHLCSQAGVRVDATVVRLALLFHDAGYGTDLSTVGCPDAEAYAGALARRALTGRIPAPVLDDVEAAILATRRTTQPDTPEGMVVRAADLADLAAGYDTFAANSEALRVEHERLSGTRLSLAEWRESVDQLLSDYLEERLWPLELLDDGSEEPGFHAAAKANLRRYLVSATDE